MVKKKLNKKAAASAPQPITNEGQKRDLDSVYRRTPRRHFANCIGDLEDHSVHQECGPFFRIFRTVSEVYTPPAGCVKDEKNLIFLRHTEITEAGGDLAACNFIAKPENSEMS